MGEPLKIFKDSVEAKMKIRFPYWDGVGEEKEEKRIGGISWITDYQSFKTEMDKEIGIFMGDCPEAIKAQCDKKIKDVFDENKKQYNSFLNLYHRPVPTHKEIQQQAKQVMAFVPWSEKNQQPNPKKKTKPSEKQLSNNNSSRMGKIHRLLVVSVASKANICLEKIYLQIFGDTRQVAIKEKATEKPEKPEKVTEKATEKPEEEKEKPEKAEEKEKPTVVNYVLRIKL